MKDIKFKLLKDIVSSVAGSGAVGIVDLLYDKKNVNEFLIAKRLKLTINQTRNILYKLADSGLVSFMRKKDRKKGGWYTYFWTLNLGKSLGKFKEMLLNELNNQKIKISSLKITRFYRCLNDDSELNEETALLHEYHCPECGELLQLKDNGPAITAIEKEIAKLEATLKSVNDELEIIGQADVKIRERRSKAEVRKKMKERSVRKKEREKLAKKEKRKAEIAKKNKKVKKKFKVKKKIKVKKKHKRKK